MFSHLNLKVRFYYIIVVLIIQVRRIVQLLSSVIDEAHLQRSIY